MTAYAIIDELGYVVTIIDYDHAPPDAIPGLPGHRAILATNFVAPGWWWNGEQFTNPHIPHVSGPSIAEDVEDEPPPKPKPKPKAKLKLKAKKRIVKHKFKHK